MQTYNSSALVAKAGGLWVWNQPRLNSEFQDSLSYIARYCLKNKKKIEIKFVCNYKLHSSDIISSVVLGNLLSSF